MVRSHLTPIIIAGPTASGKSSLALWFAQKHGGEIICADSRQFYAGMTIGTASPSAEDVKLVPHHGYGSIDPQAQKIDAGFFIAFAKQKILEIQERKRRPILVGGTGLYLRALRFDLADVPPTDPAIAASIKRRLNEIGELALYDELKNIDRLSAHAIAPTDSYRVMRALEIFQITARLPSSLRTSFSLKEPKIHAHWMVKQPDRSKLTSDIAKRVHHMFDLGLVAEAQRLSYSLPQGHWALSVMGYQEALSFVDNKMTKDQAIERVIIRHRQYAKRQHTWFKKENFYKFSLP